MKTANMGVIYALECRATDKQYIGQTADLQRRLSEHASARDDTYLHRAIRKHGWDTFYVTVVEEIPIEDLAGAERFWIDFLDCKAPKGYNMTDGGKGGLLGYQHTDETRQKISQAAMGNQRWLGRKHSAESRQRMSDVQKGHPGYMTGRKHSAKSREKISASQIGKKMSRASVAKTERTKRANRGILDWIDRMDSTDVKS